MSRDQSRMPDVPNPDFVGAICEIWFTVNYAAGYSDEGGQ
jgi:hypothetical protein